MRKGLVEILVSIPFRGKGPQGAKPNAEVVADILGEWLSLNLVG
jgi:hypothetical protein